MTAIVTVTMNPAIDVSTTVAHVEPTSKLRCTALHRDPGGGGVNVARVARRLGGDVAAIYPEGGSIGRLLTQLVEAQGIASQPIEVANETREDFTVFDQSIGDQYRFVLPGPQLSEAEWQRCLDAVAALPETPRFVVASGSLPPGVPEDFYAALARRCADRGTRIVVDSSEAALREGLKAGTFLVKPNLRELQRLADARLEDRPAQVAACRNIIASGGTQVVALTLGHEGALLVTADGAWAAPALPIKIESAVGAGDSFLGAMVWALAAGHSLEDAFRYGIAAGSAALLTPGTELCHADAIRSLLPQVTVTPV